MMLGVKDGEVQHFTHRQFAEQRMRHPVCVQLRVVLTGQVFQEQTNCRIPLLQRFLF